MKDKILQYLLCLCALIVMFAIVGLLAVLLSKYPLLILVVIILMLAEALREAIYG